MLIAALMAISTSAHCGPFGLEMAMPLPRLQGELGAQPTEGAKHSFTTTSVPQPHPDFARFQLFATPEHGLCKIIAISRSFDTSSFGDELKGKFKDLAAALASKYGEKKEYDYLKSGSLWTEPQYWMMGLLKKDRTLAAFWTSEKKPMPDSITTISLEARAMSDTRGAIVLTYDFTNIDSCLKAVTNDRDSAL